MACERSYLRVIVMIAALLSTGTTALAQWPLGGGIGALKDELKERAFMKAATALLNNDLPIILDATTAFPTVDTLPGGVFRPHPLAVSADTLSKPLPPGDYVVNVTAFCTEYSVHRPGKGVAYKLAPLKGHAAQAVSTLLWRGMKAHVPAQRLMSLTWAIQSGLSISEMPATFKADYDRLIPDYEMDLSGDFIQALEDLYNKASRGTKMPPLDVLLGKMGPAGKTVLTAKRQREALMAKGQSDEIKEQTLFAGQESGVYTPIAAEEGPWTERIPSVAYMRYKIEGGNLASNNVMEIRIIGDGKSMTKAEGPAKLLTASYAPRQFGSSLTSPTLASMLGVQQNASGDITADGMIGYSQGQGAQALIPVLPSMPNAQFQLTKATTPDAQTVVVNYTVTTQLTSPIHFAVYRSPTQDTAPSSNQIAQCDVPSAGCTVGVAGNADSDPLAVGDHTVTLDTGKIGLPPNTAFPYVVVVGTSGTQQQTTYFQKFLLGVIAHGYTFLGDLPVFGVIPKWETDMRADLVSLDFYDNTVSYDWTSASAQPNPNMISMAGADLSMKVSEKINSMTGHPGDVVDLHFIGHSRGTVVVSGALWVLAGSDHKFRGGYVEVTLLDPHPANNTWEKPWASQFTSADNNYDPLYSTSARVALGEKQIEGVEEFQSLALDPQVVLYPGIKKIEVWYQHTNSECLTGPEGAMNLWGIVGGQGLINSSGLAFMPVDKTTRPAKGGRCSNGIGHGEVPVLYEDTVVKSGTLNRNSQ